MYYMQRDSSPTSIKSRYQHLHILWRQRSQATQPLYCTNAQIKLHCRYQPRRPCTYQQQKRLTTGETNV